MEAPEFTVVMPTRGDAPHVRAAVRSVLDSGEDLELLLVHDRPGRTIAFDDPRVRVLHASRPGAASARNAGIDAARGRFIAFLDDDDLWLPGHLARARAALGADPGALLYAADVHLFYDPTFDGSAAPPSDLSTLAPLNGAWTNPVLSQRDLLLSAQLPSTTVVLRREWLSGDDRFRGELAPAEDYDLWLRLSDRHRFLWEPRPAGIVRRRFGSVSCGRRRQAEAVLEILEPRIGGGEPRGLDRASARRRLAQIWQGLAGICLLTGDGRTARKAAIRALAYRFLAPRSHAVLAASLLPAAARRVMLAGARRAAQRLLVLPLPRRMRTRLYTLASVRGEERAVPASSASAWAQQAGQAPPNPEA